MIDRRDFLAGVASIALGTRAGGGESMEANTVRQQYLADLAAVDPKILGMPRDGAAVAQALYPIGPGRVIVLGDRELRGLRDGHRGLKRRLRREESRRLARWQAERLP